jgi:hypothetical protein
MKPIATKVGRWPRRSLQRRITFIFSTCFHSLIKLLNAPPTPSDPSTSPTPIRMRPARSNNHAVHQTNPLTSGNYTWYHSLCSARTTSSFVPGLNSSASRSILFRASARGAYADPVGAAASTPSGSGRLARLSPSRSPNSHPDLMHRMVRSMLH